MSRRDGTTTKVFVGSLVPSVTPEDLRKLFSGYGKIVECDIANRCGFLHLEDKALAEKAIKDLNNTTFMGGRISVERGRVKPPKGRRRERDNVRGGGGRDRGGPYSRADDFGRGSRNGEGGGYGGRDYGYDRFGGFDRSASRGFGADFDGYSNRRPAFDGRGGDYLDDRRGYASNGYGRSYDDRMAYPDSRGGFDRGGYESRGGYDDRRIAPFGDVIDDRRALPVTDHRSLQDGIGIRGSGYDKGSSSDMYSRRGDPPTKSISGFGNRDTSYTNYGSGGAGGDNYGSAGGYSGASHGYGAVSNTAAYGGGSGYGTGYDGSSGGGGMQGIGQGAAGGSYGGGSATYGSGGGNYGSSGVGYGASAAFSSGGGGYGATSGSYGNSGAGGGYAGTGGAYGNVNSSGGYGNAPVGDSYGSGGGYGDTYGGSRGSYDTPLSASSRNFSSGSVGRGRERGITSVSNRRY